MDDQDRRAGTNAGTTAGELSLQLLKTRDLLRELGHRSGQFAAVVDALLLVMKKSADYNGAELIDDAQRDGYFPLGAASYVQMIHTKSQRLLQLVRNDLEGKPPNHESARDSCLDIINYASFFAERLARDAKRVPQKVRPGPGDAA